MKTFGTYASEWEENAERDAYWAVLTSAQYEKTGWDSSLFFHSGKLEVENLQKYIKEQKLPIRFEGEALDFGCGVGRVSQSLGPFFEKVCGVDVSMNMIQKAKAALAPNIRNIEYIHNPFPHLAVFEDEKFDFIYSNIVLQHIAKEKQLDYLKEFFRIIKPGGWIVVQIPSMRIFRSILSRMKGAMVELLPFTVRKKILVNLLRTQSRAVRDFNLEMNVCPEGKVRLLAKENNLAIEHVSYTNSCDTEFNGNLTFYEFARAKSIPGYLSPMYFMKKKTKG